MAVVVVVAGCVGQRWWQWPPDSRAPGSANGRGEEELFRAAAGEERAPLSGPARTNRLPLSLRLAWGRAEAEEEEEAAAGPGRGGPGTPCRCEAAGGTAG